MGLCASINSIDDEDDADDISRSSDRSRRASTKETESASKEVHKLLLLGCSDVGKTTLLRQLVSSFGCGFGGPDGLAPYTATVTYNTILAARMIISASVKLDSQHRTRYATSLDGDAAAVLAVSLAAPDPLAPDAPTAPERLSAQLAQRITRIWRDAGIKKTYSLRQHFFFPDTAAYFLDVLHVRARTCGMVECDFRVSDTSFRAVDVGGRRDERGRWFHAFEDVSAVLFVASLSEYDERLAESEEVNRMHESIALFAEICNSKFFYRTTIILMLTKLDVFRSKLLSQQIPLTLAFPSYTGGASESAAIDFIRDQYLARNEFADKRVIHVHTLDATDTESVRDTFAQVGTTVVQNALIRIAME